MHKFIIIGLLLFLTSPLDAEESTAKRFDVPPYVALPFPPGVADPETLCGSAPTFQDVEHYTGELGVPQSYASGHEPSTAQIRWLPESEIRARLPDHVPGNVGGEKWCTGTLISKSHFLTAAHCVQPLQDFNGGWVTPYRPQGMVPADAFALAKLQTINFKFQVDRATGAERAPDVFPVVKLLEYGFDAPGSLDYALIELGPNSSGALPGDIYKIATVIIRKPTAGETTAIIQHPSGMPKKIEAGKILQVEGPIVYYNDVDTLGGSSGSGIRDNAGNIIGVHTNGGCPFTGNSGVTTEAVSAVSSDF
jgi:hypothetical protein